MKHMSMDDLKVVAAVNDAPHQPLTPRDRLSRWADLLDQRGQDRLSTLAGTEHTRPQARAEMRAENSPLSVAYADPLLRADGLEDETYGAARRYFGLDHWQLHDVVCDCHSGASVSGTSAARRVRGMADHWRPSLFAGIGRLLFG